MSNPGSMRPFRIGDWRVDPALDEIVRDGRRTKLEPRMMRLLCCLAERAGEVVSLSTLLDRVWAGVVVSQSSVYQAVAQLRRELGDDEDEPRYIATVPRKGYRLVAPVGADVAPAAGSAISASPPRPRRRALPLAAAGALALAVGVAAWWLAPDRAALAEKPAIAVLPFEDLSDDASNEVFCEGLTDEVLNSLARVPALRVIGRNSSGRFRDQSADPKAIGTALGVSHILEGSVRRAGNRVRVSAQLVSAEDGFQLWSNSYDRPARDAIGVQTQIARAVVEALSVQLSEDDSRRLDRGPTAQVSAYDLYLLGRHQQLKRTPDALERAIEHHRSAIAEDPGFALAWAGLADAEMARYYYAGRPLDDVAPRVQAAVDAALRLDPELPEAYAAWAVLLTERWETEEAIRALERAIAINSNYGEAYLRLGAAYEYDGQPLAALEAFDQVLALDPLHTILHVRRCLALQNLGRYADAERACERAFELQPDIPNALWARGLNALAQGDLPAAVRHYQAALSRAPARADIRAELVLTFLDLGLAERAKEQLALLSASDRAPGAAMAPARHLLAAGDAKELRQHLSRLDLGRASPRERLEAAWLALAIGDQPLAERLVGDALVSRPQLHDELQPGLYRTRWGFCEACTGALLERRRGNADGAASLESMAMRHLEGVESKGHVWHGLHYVRATLQAQAGSKREALASLEKAADLGWRRAWLMRVDPALDSLRDDPRFQAVLARIDSANASSRQALASLPPR